ncbi:hypothetical protein N431DRAFT_292207, partial [Stipitochalara longipes BDJ]
RFYYRTLCCIFVPPAFAAYYIWTYITWLNPSSDPVANIDRAIPNGKYIWWSWFIIGAVGLNVSNYCLAGVEAAMITIPQLGPQTVDQVIAHSGMLWSTLGAWKFVTAEFYLRIFSSYSGEKRSRITWLWVVLFVLSTLSWSFVLSGLTMQTTDGYKAGHIPGVHVVGVNSTSIDGRLAYNVISQAYGLWQSGSPPTLPLRAALYTTSGSNFVANVSAPNTLPPDAGPGGIFLAPQAETPLTGTTWGLLIKYSCSEVHNLNEFTILSRRINSTNPDFVDLNSDVPNGPDSTVAFYYNLEGGSSIVVLNNDILTVTNIGGVAEIGLSSGFDILREMSALGYNPLNTSDSSDPTPGPQGPTYTGIDDIEILEFLLWQGGVSFGDSFTPVQDPISSLGNEYPNMQAIGARCTSSSVAGNAKINGLSGTFTDFVREDPPSVPDEFIMPRFSFGAPFIFIQPVENGSEFDWVYFGDTYPFGDWPPLNTTEPLDPKFKNPINYTTIQVKWDWLEPLFDSANVPFSIAGSGSLGDNVYSRLMEASDLKTAILFAYQHYAVQLMYNGQEAIVNAWPNTKLNPAVPWTLLTSGGGVPPLLVLILMVIWAVGCSILGIWFGFRKRWGETFDYYSMYRYCTEK